MSKQFDFIKIGDKKYKLVKLNPLYNNLPSKETKNEDKYILEEIPQTCSECGNIKPNKDKI